MSRPVALPRPAGRGACCRPRRVSVQLNFVGANLRPDAVAAPHGRALGQGRGNPSTCRTPGIDKDARLWAARPCDDRCTSCAGTQLSVCAVPPFGSADTRTSPESIRAGSLGNPHGFLQEIVRKTRAPPGKHLGAAQVPGYLFPPPALRECRHRSLARLRVAVRAILVVAECERRTGDGRSIVGAWLFYFESRQRG
jgi:hypothetical protein